MPYEMLTEDPRCRSSHVELIEEVARNLWPAPRIRSAADDILAILTAGGAIFNGIHLRMEADAGFQNWGGGNEARRKVFVPCLLVKPSLGRPSKSGSADGPDMLAVISRPVLEHEHPAQIEHFSAKCVALRQRHPLARALMASMFGFPAASRMHELGARRGRRDLPHARCRCSSTCTCSSLKLGIARLRCLSTSLPACSHT